MTPMPDTGRTSPIARRAGCPSCRTSPIARCAGCPSCRTSPIARRAECPSCRMSLNARRAGCPSACAESRAARVPVNARRAGRVPRADTSPGQCPSCRRVPCQNESRSMPVTCHAPAQRSACSRRRQPLYCEHIFACTPWRFRNARSAARLRRDVGPLTAIKTMLRCLKNNESSVRITLDS